MPVALIFFFIIILENVTIVYQKYGALSSKREPLLVSVSVGSSRQIGTHGSSLEQATQAFLFANANGYCKSAMSPDFYCLQNWGPLKGAGGRKNNKKKEKKKLRSWQQKGIFNLPHFPVLLVILAACPKLSENQ